MYNNLQKYSFSRFFPKGESLFALLPKNDEIRKIFKAKANQRISQNIKR